MAWGFTEFAASGVKSTLTPPLPFLGASHYGRIWEEGDSEVGHLPRLFFGTHSESGTPSPWLSAYTQHFPDRIQALHLPAHANRTSKMLLHGGTSSSKFSYVIPIRFPDHTRASSRPWFQQSSFQPGISNSSTLSRIPTGHPSTSRRRISRTCESFQKGGNCCGNRKERLGVFRTS